MSYRIPELNMARLDADIEKLNRRAVKLGVQPVTLTQIRTEEEVWLIDRADPRLRYKANDVRPDLLEDRFRRVVLRFSVIEVSGETPRLAGWAFVATLDHTAETGVILRIAPGEAVPESYRTAAPVCDHCGTNRRRRETFVVRHDDGAYKQVGRQCIVDFLGGQTPENLAERAAWFGLLGEALRGAEEWDGADGFGRGESRWPVADVLTAGSAAITKHGWISRKAATDTARYATADRLIGVFTARVIADDDRLVVTDADRALAEKTVEWGRALAERPNLSDYEHNVHVLLSGTSLRTKDFGVAASAIVAYQREVGKLAQRNGSGSTSQHFGEVGKRAEYVLTITNRIDIPGDWGITRLYIMADATGNQAKTFSSRILWKAAADGMTESAEIGDTWRIKATVRGHETYKGIAYTNLSRAVLVERVTDKEETR